MAKLETPQNLAIVAERLITSALEHRIINQEDAAELRKIPNHQQRADEVSQLISLAKDLSRDIPAGLERKNLTDSEAERLRSYTSAAELRMAVQFVSARQNDGFELAHWVSELTTENRLSKARAVEIS